MNDDTIDVEAVPSGFVQNVYDEGIDGYSLKKDVGEKKQWASAIVQIYEN